MFLVNFEFTINFGSLAAFLTGILCGVILFILIYFLYVMLYLNKKEINLHSNSDIVTEDDIKNEIKKSQDKFLELKKSYGVITIDSLKDVTVELISNIAKLYYPDSKQPIAELTIKELILLDKYLIEKIDTLLNTAFSRVSTGDSDIPSSCDMKHDLNLSHCREIRPFFESGLSRYFPLETESTESLSPTYC